MITRGFRLRDFCPECQLGVTRRIGLFALFLTVLMALAGCQGARTYVPVFGAGEQKNQGARSHIVQRGETLYAIAFRYGLDYKGLAAANDIRSPYTIYVDQRISLSTVKAPKAAKAVTTRQKIDKTPAASKVALPAPVKRQESDLLWRWPATGEVINGFSLSGRVNKGVDIGGKLGESVFAAAAGVVVYAGDGLRGYGKLVIVKHNDQFLSAYGYNRKILVKEGQNVNGGQAVAEIGLSGANQEILHFEIRRNGKPQDPLLYLPKRVR
jgi:lipoprotein NlpD